MKAVFDIRRQSPQHPEATLRYVIPNRSIDLEIARACVGDWIIFRETNRSGGIGYVSVARVEAVEHLDEEQSIWEVVLSEYLAFPSVVPLQVDGNYLEREVQKVLRSSQVGRLFHGRAIREINDDEFGDIIAAGLGIKLTRDLNLDAKPQVISGFMQDEVPFDDIPRRIEHVLLNRPIREAAFRQRVCAHYAYTCAVTRLCFRDGRGGFEAQAAHIWSVKDRGPDLIYNGICLCGVAHWLFDHYVISIDPQFHLLVNQALIPSESSHFLPPAGTPLLLPATGVLLRTRATSTITEANSSANFVDES